MPRFAARGNVDDGGVADMKPRTGCQRRPRNCGEQRTPQRREESDELQTRGSGGSGQGRPCMQSWKHRACRRRV